MNIEEKVSVIVPTYNGEKKIISVLTALSNQTFSNFETVVVVDGSTDNTISLLQDRNWKIQDLKIVEQNNSGRAVVRNRGASEASGSILIFFDDDMSPERDCVRRHVEFHKSNKHSILVGGCLLRSIGESFISFNAYRLDRELTWLRGKTSEIVRVSLDNYIFTSQNFSLDKKTFFSIGGFDDTLTDSEDFDLSMRALKENIPMYYDYQTFAFHEDHVGIEDYIKRQSQYFKSKMLLSKLKPEYTRMHPQSFKSSHMSIWRSFLLYPFKLNRVWFWLLKSRIKFLFGKRLLFKIYDLIIHASSINRTGSGRLSIKTTILNFFRKALTNKMAEGILLHGTIGRSTNGLVSKLVPSHYLYPVGSKRNVQRNGFRFELDISDLVEWHVYYGFEEPAHRSLWERCRTNDIALDIGANIGSFLMQLSSKVPEGKVIGFEPYDKNYQKCERHIELNQIRNAELINCGLGEANGKISMQIIDPQNLGMTKVDLANQNSDTRVVTVDEFVEDSSLSRVDIIKIDTEGFEMRILKGASNTLKRYKPIMLIELSDFNLKYYGSSAMELVTFLEKMHYRVLNAVDHKVELPRTNLSGCHIDVLCLPKEKLKSS